MMDIEKMGSKHRQCRDPKKNDFRNKKTES